jgi:hypothetical protein
MLIIAPPKFRPNRGREKQPKANQPPVPPINTITSVTIQPDGVTCDIFLTPGTVVVGIDMPSDNFFINYGDGLQTSATFATIIHPAQVRLALSDVVDAPATWEMDSADYFTFATGEFGGPNGGDVIFPG